jgi:hypothetical protein
VSAAGTCGSMIAATRSRDNSARPQDGLSAAIPIGSTCCVTDYPKKKQMVKTLISRA